MKRKLLIATSLLALSPMASFAALGDLGGVGVQQNYTQEQMRQNQLEKNLERTKKERKKIEKAEEGQEAIKQGAISKEKYKVNPSFDLVNVEFTGNSVVKTKKLDKMAKKYEGRTIYFDELVDLANEVTSYYQKKGYLTSFATIPEQRIKDGIATIHIVESKVSKREVTGEKWTREAYINKIIMGKKGLREGDVFSAKALQFALREMNDQPYNQVNTEIKKTANTHLTEIKLDVQDRFPVLLNAGYDNYGRKVTGRQRGTVIAGMHNLTGFGDKIYGGAIMSSGSTGVIAGYEIPLSPYGTKLGYEYSYSDVSLGDTLKNLGITGKSESHIIRLTQPLIKSARTNLVSSLALDFTGTRSDSGALATNLSEYNLTVLRAAIYGQHDDAFGRTIADLGVDCGLNAWGGSFGYGLYDEQFVKLSANLIRVQPLPLNTLGILRVSGQYSPDKLTPLEQMQIGGPFTLRGYQPAELIGDYGVTGTAELRFNVPFLKALLPKKIENQVDERVKMAVFYDFGYVKEHGGLYGYPKNFLHSVGSGFYVNLYDNISAQVGLAVPLGKRYYNEQSVQVYAGISADLDRFIPLRDRQESLNIDEL